MYCRACGKELENNTNICMNCGVPMGKGSSFCPACGGETCKDAVFCVRCGVGFIPPQPVIPKDARSRVVAGLLGIFLGGFGAHNFYIKRTGRAVIQLLVSLVYLIAYISFMVFVRLSTDYFAIGLFGILIFVGFLARVGIGIWAFVESILLFCGNTKVDGRGRPFRD